jgi:hypothetical protein
MWTVTLPAKLVYGAVGIHARSYLNMRTFSYSIISTNYFCKVLFVLNCFSL